MLKNLKKKKKGFTLIELIIVIAIIAILAALALPKFSSVRESANVKSDIANGKTVYTATVALIGEGKVTTDTTKKTIEVVNSAAGGKEQDAIVGYLDGTPTGKSKAVRDKNFVVTIDSDGSVKVYIKSATASKGYLVYPNTNGALGSEAAY